MCWKLKAMYGARDAAQTSEWEYTEMMVEAGPTQGSYSARVFYHGETDIRAVVHGDDLSALSSRRSLDRLREVIQQRPGVTCKGSLESRRLRAARNLYSIVTVASGVLEHEVDQRQGEILMKDVGRDGRRERGSCHPLEQRRRGARVERRREGEKVHSGGGERKLLGPG